ncbi:hypothetical protein [Agromyces sp. Marseille-Q5079]
MPNDVRVPTPVDDSIGTLHAVLNWPPDKTHIQKRRVKIIPSGQTS